MTKCARCGLAVDDVYEIPPDVITEELLDSIDHGEEAFSGGGVLKVCAECMSELDGD